MIFGHAVRRNAIKIAGDRGSTLHLARGRLVMISTFFVLAYVLLAMRVVDLTAIQGELAPARQHDVVSADPSASSVSDMLRADIRDRNGALLATTLKTASLYADTRLLSSPQEAARGLVKVFPDLAYGKVLQKLQSGKAFVWIKRNIMPDEQYAVLELGQPGLDFRYENRRVYPHGGLAAHLAGYTDIDSRGQAGVERSFEKLLSGGEELDLTIDVRLQHSLHRELARAIEEFDALGGAGVIMDVTNGEVLAGVSLPDFDPHNAGSADPSSVFNRLTLGVYELGSVFKVFSTAALFEALDVPMSTTFDAREPIKRGRFTINDYHAEERILTLPEVFMYSSNIGSAMMGEAVGTESLKGFYEDLGLLTPLDLEILEVAKPLVPYPWRDINTLTASYGHGVATTPLQLTAAVSSIVNGGYLVKPRLVKSEGEISDAPPAQIRVVSPKTGSRMKQLMRLVVADGTGSKADVPGYRVAGKTGTAEKTGKGGYDSKRLISSFVAVFPIDEPRYAVFIMVDEPKGNKESFGYATGGWVAAPAVARVISSMVSILGLEPRVFSPEQDLSASLKHYIAERDDG